MIRYIAIREFRNNILTPAFIVGMLLCLALIPYTVYTGIKTYENRLAQYETDMKAAEDVYRKAIAYSRVNPLPVKPVSPLSIFSRGIAEQTGSKVQLNYREKPVFSSGIVLINENPFMGGFLSLDFATAIAVLLSLLGILFSYDMLSREKEQGTLRQVLSNPVSRSAFFLGKLAGIFLTLAPILVVCILAILPVIRLSPSIRFTAGDCGRIGMLLLTSLVYFAFFVFLGGFISSRTRSSRSSIILNLFIWCFLLFLLPNAASWLGKNITPVKDYKQLQFDTGQIDKQWREVQSKEVEEILGKENLRFGNAFFYMGNGWDGGDFMMFTPAPTMQYERRKKELAFPILLDNCARKWAIQSDYLQQVYRQEKTMRYLTCLSPAGIFKHLAASLCRTGVDGEVHFMNRVRQFHDVFYGYIVQNKIYSSYAYITPQKEEDFPGSNAEAQAQSNSWLEKNFGEGGFSFRDLDFGIFGYADTQSFPRFDYTPPPLGSDLYEQLYLIAGILIACILLFWFSFVSFIKYDVR
jgi:ABC-type transport system involved in multi-copper enzyme maturation permease subunit